MFINKKSLGKTYMCCQRRLDQELKQRLVKANFAMRGDAYSFRWSGVSNKLVWSFFILLGVELNFEWPHGNQFFSKMVQDNIVKISQYLVKALNKVCTKFQLNIFPYAREILF